LLSLILSKKRQKILENFRKRKPEDGTEVSKATFKYKKVKTLPSFNFSKYGLHHHLITAHT